MQLDYFFNRLARAPASIEFPDAIALINNLYTFTPTGFRNCDIHNAAGRNNGACRIFAFARLHDLDSDQTLALFGAFYRADVLSHPDARNHLNIRQFMRTGWPGIEFHGVPLRARPFRQRAVLAGSG